MISGNTPNVFFLREKLRVKIRVVVRVRVWKHYLFNEIYHTTKVM